MSLADPSVEPEALVDAVAAQRSNVRAGDFFASMKPRVMSLVVFTAFVGMLVAPGSHGALTIGIALSCIAVGAGGAGALNMWYETEYVV